MIKLFSLTFLTACLLSSASQAQTTWTGGTTDFIGDAGFWDNGLPTNAGNPGTIGGDARWTNDGNGGSNTLTDYYLEMTGGAINANQFGGRTFDGGQQSFNGGSASFNSGLTLTDTVFSVDNGSSTLTLPGDFRVDGTTTATLNAGTLNSLVIEMFDSASFTMNGGTATVTNNFGSNNFSGGGSAALNGGTLTAATLDFRHTWTLTVGGTTAGSATFGDFGNTSNIDIDVLSGSLMDLTITGTANWAETQWGLGNLTFGGQDFSTLGDWSTVTTAGGLNGTESFSFDSGTNTLSLAVIPEPSTFALVGLAGLVILAARRPR